MKNIYKQLNGIEIDTSKYKEASVSPFEIEKVKKELKKQIHRKKQPKWRQGIIAAALSIGLATTALFSLSFTALANEIPLLQSIFNFFNQNEVYKAFDEHANSIIASKEQDGVNVTINQAVFDGKSIYITYTIESNNDFGDFPHIEGLTEVIGSNSFISSTHHKVKKIGEKQYVGITTGNLTTEESLSTGSFAFTIKKIISETGQAAKNGDWHFAFDLDATSNHIQLVNQTTENKELTVQVNQITYTPMSFLIQFDEIITKEIIDKWNFVTTDIEVKDNLGNVYNSEHNGGYGNTTMHLKHTFTFEQLHPNATSLIITPTITLSMADGKDDNGNIYRTMNSTAPIQKMQLEPVIVEINKK